MTKTIDWDGKTITKPGLYGRLGIDLYHSGNICDGPSISSSGLRKIFSQSPAHYWAESPLNPNRLEQDAKAHFTLGRAVHHLMLGEPFFAKLFAIQPDEYPDSKTGEMKPWNNNANFAKAWHTEREAEGKSVLTPTQVDQIKGMAQSLGHHPLIAAGALNGQIERSGFVKDKKTGVWLKVRPDSIPNDSGDYVDLKTTTSVVWNDLVRTIGDFGYHQQMALIRRVVRELGLPFTSATLVFVESKAPFCTRVVTLKENDLDRGEKQNAACIQVFADCLKAKHWPGPGGDREDAEYIELGEFAQKRIDDKLTIMGAG